MAEQKYLEPEEVAKKFGLSVRTIKEWCREGKIIAVKVGPSGIWRIPESSVDSLIKQPGKSTIRKMGVAIAKGGTGKTTTAVSLAHNLALRGFKVLIVDTDTQGQVAPSLGVRPVFYLSHVFRKQKSLQEVIIPARENLDIVPSNMSLIEAKNELLKDDSYTYIFRNLFTPVEKNYDYIIFDTGPGYDQISIGVLSYISELIIPLSPQALPLFGMQQFLDIVNIAQGINPNLKVSYILPTLAKTKARLTAEVLEWLDTSFHEQLCDPIRENIKIAEAPSHGKTIFEYSPDSDGAKDYKIFADRVVKRG